MIVAKTLFTNSLFIVHHVLTVPAHSKVLFGLVVINPTQMQPNSFITDTMLCTDPRPEQPSRQSSFRRGRKSPVRPRSIATASGIGLGCGVDLGRRAIGLSSPEEVVRLEVPPLEIKHPRTGTWLSDQGNGLANGSPGNW